MAGQQPQQPDVPRSPTGRVPKWVLDETIQQGNVARFPDPSATASKAAKPSREPRWTDTGGAPGGLGGRGYATPRRTRLIVASLFFVVPLVASLTLMLIR